MGGQEGGGRGSPESGLQAEAEAVGDGRKAIIAATKKRWALKRAEAAKAK
jgi:hypothetical protein